LRDVSFIRTTSPASKAAGISGTEAGKNVANHRCGSFGAAGKNRQTSCMPLPEWPKTTRKGQQSRIGNQINAIQTDRTPNFCFMQYELATWRPGGIGRDDLMARLSEELCESSISTT